MKRSRTTTAAARAPFKPPAKKKQMTVARGYQSGRSHPGAPKAELKVWDVSINQAFSNAGVITVVNVMAIGSEIYNRVGRKVYMKSLRFSGYLTNTATSVQDYARFVVVYDSNPNGAAPALADIFQNMNGPAATTGFSHLNMNNRERFQIIRDKRFSLPAVTNTAGVLTNMTLQDPIKQSFQIDEFCDMKGLEITYNANATAGIADITAGAVYIVTFGNTGVTWSLQGENRLRYYD